MVTFGWNSEQNLPGGPHRLTRQGTDLRCRITPLQRCNIYFNRHCNAQSRCECVQGASTSNVAVYVMRRLDAFGFVGLSSECDVLSQ